jgi:hypothetical protein
MRIVTRIVLVFVGLAMATGSFAQDKPVPVPPPVLSDHQLLRKYVWSTLGPAGMLEATAAGGLDQWQSTPPEWGPDKAGYARRWVSEFAESAIGGTTKYAVARLFHHDPSFTRCECSGVGPRLRHALLSPFTARTRDGRTVPSPATIAGLMAEHIVPATTWYPVSGPRDGFRHAGSSVLAKMGVDVFREFVSLHRRPSKP